MSELIFLLLLFGIPGFIGVYLARRRRKNPLLWGLLCGIFPFFILVLKLNHKPVIDNPAEQGPPDA
ncbi:MAG: hypothetical protein Fur0034_19380 [Desulfuromonadia bacterium]